MAPNETSQFPGRLPSPAPAGPLPEIRVLLLEDNAGFRYYVRDLLMRKHRGRFQVEEACTLGEGRAILRRGGIDILLLDLGLPDSVRIETFAAARAESPDTPIVVLTVLDDDEVAKQAMRAGAQDYLVKDQVDGNLLVRAIDHALDRARSEKALHHLSARILQLQDEERRHIARELHDTTAQNLAALSMNLSALCDRAATMDPRAREILEDTRRCAENCVRELRTMSYLLHPPLLDEVGLAGAVREYADGFAARSGIRVDLELPPRLGRLPIDIETALFRVMQESLANILRHSGSPSASIQFALGPSEIRLDVRDAGRGIPADKQPGAGGEVVSLGVGIRGMFERVRQLGGRLDVHTGEGGTTVRATLPLPAGALA